MKSVENTFMKACGIIEEIGGQPSPETAAIRHILISPEIIMTFGREDLYLALIKKLVRERFNLSFPEDPASYDCFLSDCARLADRAKKDRKPFNQEEWLNDCYHLFENVKTPYYETYADTVFLLRSCFHDSGKAGAAISEVYSILIKAEGDHLNLIRSIVLHLPSYRKYPRIDDSLLLGILKDSLNLFGPDKNFWLTSLTELLYGVKTRSLDEIHPGRLLDKWLETEDRFLADTFSEKAEDSDGSLSLSSYLAKRAVWFARHKAPSSSAEDIIFSLHRSSGGSAPGGEFLNTYAYNMNAASYVTDPAIGREQEIQDLELILISPKKSPVIIGEAGVGKTAVVEGLAYRLAKGDVPNLLKDRVIYKLTTTSLLGGAKYVGEMEERIRTLTTELHNHPEIILFIDEIHTIVGAGSTESSNNDISNMIKPFIDRGDIKIIGATTADEYERFLVPDRALARRFYPILVEEPDEELCLRILAGSIPTIEYHTRVRNNYSEEATRRILKLLISLCPPENQPEGQITRLPELPLSVLEMAFSYAALENRARVTTADLAKAAFHSNRLNKETRKAAEEMFLNPDLSSDSD